MKNKIKIDTKIKVSEMYCDNPLDESLKVDDKLSHGKYL